MHLVLTQQTHDSQPKLIQGSKFVYFGQSAFGGIEWKKEEEILRTCCCAIRPMEIGEEERRGSDSVAGEVEHKMTQMSRDRVMKK